MQKEHKNKLKSIPLKIISLFVSIPVGWIVLWLVVKLFGPQVNCDPALWIPSMYVQPFIRLSCHASKSSGFLSFLFSGPTILFFIGAFGCFFVAGGLVGLITRGVASEWIGFGMVAIVFGLTVVTCMQNLGSFQGALGEIGRQASFYAIGSWIVFSLLVEKAASWGAGVCGFFWKLASGG